MIIVQDNFFKDPYAVRQFALQQEYFPSYNSSWPGIRHQTEDVSLLRKIENFANQYTPCKLSHSNFQSVGSKFDEGHFHVDLDYDYIVIVFLDPKPEPYSGTEVCDLSVYPPEFLPKNIWYPQLKHKENFYRNPDNLWLKIKSTCYRKLTNGYFPEPMAKVPNKFNRVIMFESKLVHRAQKFYGKTLKDSRLTLVTFLNK